MESKSPNLVQSGIEPVDKLLGGLEQGQLYLVHGDAAGKSLFGIKFLIEGLKRGESGALVIRYSPEDAVRRFARLGYDCLEDVYSGRLVILEYSNDIIQQIARLRELTPVLRELEWLLGETHPQRLIFDPVTHLVLGEVGELEPRVREFAGWASSFGATVALIANGERDDVVRYFMPLVRESFRFEVKEEGDRATRFFLFEKSDSIPDQPIEVDPSRGVFLLGRAQAQQEQAPAIEITPVTADTSDHDDKHERAGVGRVSRETGPLDDAKAATRIDGVEALAEMVESELTGLPLSGRAPEAVTAAGNDNKQDARIEIEPDELSDLLDELVIDAPPTSLSKLEEEKPGYQAEEARAEQPLAGESKSGPRANLDSKIAARATELLLRPPESKLESQSSLPHPPPAAAPVPSVGETRTQAVPGDFNVLVIDDDPATCESIANALGEYNLEIVHDGVSGLAKLLSFKPDLVLLDVDLPIIDGFKVLAHIRSSLNMPVIILSGSHMRASDRVMASELGADYYLTKPFSVKELRHKTRQLIARYRGISSWIVTAPPAHEQTVAAQPQPGAAKTPAQPPERGADQGVGFTHYKDFTERVEANVKAALDKSFAFSIVGCRVPHMTANGGIVAVHLFEIVRSLVRDTDLISTNPRNDLVIMLSDADSDGARAFISRLRERILNEINQEPVLWMRSFPDLEDKVEIEASGKDTTPGILSRRASDRLDRGGPSAEPALERRGGTRSKDAARRPDTNDSYIDTIEAMLNQKKVSNGQ